MEYNVDLREIIMYSLLFQDLVAGLLLAFAIYDRFFGRGGRRR